MNNKKAQVNLFIIIGIVIIIVAGIIIVINLPEEKELEKEVTIQVAEKPVEFLPISNFVENCIAQIGTEGIKQIGFHGGYTDLEKYGIKANPANPTKSNAFLFNPKDLNSGVAYWYYFKSDN